MNILEARRRVLGAGVYKKTVTGNPAIAQGSLSRMYPGIEMQGWTEQDGTPTPENPVPIVSAGNWNEETQKWKYGVKLTGKNLFDAEYFRTTQDWKKLEDGNGYPYIPIYIGKGNTITISTDGTPDEGLGFYCAIARTNKNTSGNVYAWIYHSTNANLIKTNVSFEVVEDDYIYFALNSGHNNIENFLNAFTNFQIEISAQRTEYQPYKEQTVTLTSDRPLTKWDKLEKRNGQWGWVYKSDEYTMTGEEVFYIGNKSYIGELTSDSYINVNNLQNLNQSQFGYYGFSNYLKIYLAVWSDKFDGVEGFAYNAKQIHVRISNEDTGVVAEDTTGEARDKIKAYCAQRYADGIPFIFWYETAEETFVPLSASEQEQMSSLHTFRPTTVLSNDAGCEMSLTYKTKKSLEVTT